MFVQRVLLFLTLLVSATTVQGNAWTTKSVARLGNDVETKSTRSSHKLATRGGANLLDPLDQGKVMDWRTALKYKAGALLEGGLLLGVLAAGKTIDRKYTADNQQRNVLVYSMWGLIIFGSDAIVGAVRKLQVKLGVGQPRATLQDGMDWYKHLSKPSWTPPDWAFPAIWIPLKILQVIACRIVWVKTRYNIFAAPILLFLATQSMADNWNDVFFRSRYIKGGLSVIYQFSALLALATYSFFQVDATAGKLLLPTCAWMVIATALNHSIYRKNY